MKETRELAEIEPGSEPEPEDDDLPNDDASIEENAADYDPDRIVEYLDESYSEENV